LSAGDERLAHPSCLRCEDSLLNPAGEVHADVAFFDCPRCGRRYALKPGRDLTFRWGHPISHALYPIIFSPSLQAEAGRAVDVTLKGRTPDERTAIIAEIRMELDHPTQRVTDILDCMAGEDEVREYLRRYCELGAGLD
jgi:hypothetical protein